MNTPSKPLTIELLEGAIKAARPRRIDAPYDEVTLVAESWEGAVRRSGLTYADGMKMRLMSREDLFVDLRGRKLFNFCLDDWTAVMMPAAGLYGPESVVFLDLEYERTLKVEALLYGGRIVVSPEAHDYQFWQKVRVDRGSPAYIELAQLLSDFDGRARRHYLSDSQTYVDNDDEGITIWNNETGPGYPTANLLKDRGVPINVAPLLKAATKDRERAQRKEDWADALT